MVVLEEIVAVGNAITLTVIVLDCGWLHAGVPEVLTLTIVKTVVVV
jgi:hypothetical protein